MEKIGFIGLGAMGRPMASNMARKGFSLVVYDLNKAAVDQLVALGAKAAGSVAEVAAAVDMVITMLPNSPDVEAVVLGPGGIVENAKEGTLVMDMSTIDPAVTDKLSKACLEAGLAFVDAPVGRTVPFAVEGKSLFMVGASSNDLGRVRPMLDAMGDTVVHCGAPGAGIRMKLVNNFVAISLCQLNAEALTLAQSFGLDTKMTWDVLNGTTATNGQLKVNWPAHVLAGNIEPGFRIDLALKDLTLAVDAAKKNGVPMLAGVATREAFLMASKAAGLGDKDFSATLVATCKFAGLPVPRLPK